LLAETNEFWQLKLLKLDFSKQPKMMKSETAKTAEMPK
jgi:hypothetical protein